MPAPEIVVKPKEVADERRIPCPRLCGFSFWGGGNGGGTRSGYGKEVGTGVVFNNGAICDVWKWYLKRTAAAGLSSSM